MTLKQHATTYNRAVHAQLERDIRNKEFQDARAFVKRARDRTDAMEKRQNWLQRTKLLSTIAPTAVGEAVTLMGGGPAVGYVAGAGVKALLQQAGYGKRRPHRTEKRSVKGIATTKRAVIAT